MLIQRFTGKTRTEKRRTDCRGAAGPTGETVGVALGALRDRARELLALGLCATQSLGNAAHGEPRGRCCWLQLAPWPTETQSVLQEHWAGRRASEGLPGKHAVQHWHRGMEAGPGGVCSQG